ncbi:Acetoacetate decarboxylase (ADC) [Sinosporangium album]|uniref:Acetoacetate decarboxylase (ADC) n=1 Tax=Sinosporangium album TaxID=504805 RepID=A0A1G7TKH4_9ACTN|nr:acetoacetate decarboxylase family protein [Sinosporangium album]SDG35010.1 Acetoacetate decarboxylase (ADC) [Sinosporangium album]
MSVDDMTHPDAGPVHADRDVLERGETGTYAGDLAVVGQVAAEIARAADEIRGVSARLTATVSRLGLAGARGRAARSALAAQRALLRAVVSPRGLGYALTGGRLGATAERIGGWTGQESLAVMVAVTSLRLRIAAVAEAHPECMTDPALHRLIQAVSADKSLQAARALREIVKDRGIQQTLTRIAPIFIELLAVNALLDENPANDESGWAIAAGRSITSEPLLGVSVNAVCRWDVGDGSAEPVELAPAERAKLSEAGTVNGFLRNIAIVGNTGRVLIQRIQGPDGVERYAVHIPGMQCGMPRNDSPQDMVGAWRNTLMNESPYTRAVAKAIEHFGVPDKAEIAVIGHSEGGAAAMNLAQEPAFHERYSLTHVIAIGAPVDFKKPPPHVFVATITNQHDLIPSLDGQGPGSPFHFHPDWYVVDYTDSTHEFPVCHNAWHYLDNLEYDLHEAREHINASLAPYQGTVTAAQAYRLFDEVRSPDGFPFLTVATSLTETASGPVEMPVRCSDGTAVNAFFHADADAARELLAGTGLAPALLGGRAVVAVLPRAYRKTSIGAFQEVGVAVVVHDPWRPRPLLVWPELLRRGDRRGSGLRVLDLAMGPGGAPGLAAGSAVAPGLAREVWGYPAFPAQVGVALSGNVLTVDVREEGRPVMELAGRLGPWTPGPELDLVTYSRKDGATLRSLVDTRGAQRLHLVSGLRLRASGDHPMAERLRVLGLDGTRPFLVLATDRLQARLGAGAPVTLPA